MTSKEKQLLFKDLCGRLPYRVMCHANEINLDGELLFINRVYNIVALYNDKATGKFDTCPITDIKPYLRPMSSMTEEEKKSICSMNMLSGIELNDRINHKMYVQNYTIETFDLFNSHHLDYRGLIEEGLALEAPDEMYKAE